MTDDDDEGNSNFQTKDPLKNPDQQEGFTIKEKQGKRDADMKQAYANPFNPENIA